MPSKNCRPFHSLTHINMAPLYEAIDWHLAVVICLCDIMAIWHMILYAYNGKYTWKIMLYSWACYKLWAATGNKHSYQVKIFIWPPLTARVRGFGLVKHYLFLLVIWIDRKVITYKSVENMPLPTALQARLQKRGLLKQDGKLILSS